MTDERVDPFIALYRAEHSEQVRRAFLLIGSQAVADELVHDAFASVYERWSQIDAPAAYLNRCVIHNCRRYGRRRSVVDVGRTSDTASGSLTVADGDFVDGVEIANVLLGLSFRERAAIVLRFYAGMTESEIAVALKCRPGSVGPLIHRGLKKLRKELA